MLLVVLSLVAFCQVGYSTESVLTLDDLPTSGESVLISSDSVFAVNSGETAVIEGTLSVNGTDDSLINFEIINFGELTIKSTSIRCNHANFTIQNRGTLTVQTSHFTVVGDSTLNIGNTVDCSMTETSFDVIGGYAYIQNVGSLTIHNGYFKDQFDGTLITNYGTADLSECTFVANGAEGKIEIFSSSDLQLAHGVFDVNYGGKVNLNTLTGTLTMTECNMDISGASHGRKSEINFLIGNSTLDSCSIVNNGGTINCLNTGEVYVTDCTVSMSSVNATTILSSSGPMFFESVDLSGSGSASITNWDYMRFSSVNFECSDSLTLMNNGELDANDWFIKTTSSNARIVVYIGDDGSIKFNVPFIENVDSSVLASVGPDGQEFVESSGGTITVTNNNLIAKQNSTNGGFDSNLIYILVVAAVVIVVVIFFMMKKKQKPDSL
ncbi:MAG: hypothetical protein CW691_01950 [Candidatus Bathyarchaeum sp.]|nr:MAG: hypothetical protein CW691_01950 [Candidatus Bathyarchaeum sp.]